MTARPSRRAVLGSGLGLTLAAALAPAAGAHTPYGQWVVYRQKHLLIGAHRGDLRTYELAKSTVETLTVELPEARARVARGPRPERIASLLYTGQLMTTVLSDDEAAAMAEARPPFEDHYPTPLRRLAAYDGDYSLYASPAFPDDHAWLVAEALAHTGAERPSEDAAIGVHRGAAAFWAGEPIPG